MNFTELNVQENIIKALKELGIVEPTVIQQKAIPIIKSGQDLVGMSRTGSGKTAAFGIPILDKIKPNQGLQVIIMAPTRELAYQLSGELQKFGKYMRYRIATIFGGVALGPQIDQMARADIVVGTPGRLLDHLNRGNLNLSRINCFVLDEADKMVEMGFIEDIEQILNATISGEIDRIKRQHMKNPVIAEAEKHVKQELLEQYYYNTKQHEKFSLLVHLLKKEQTRRVIIFCSTRATVELISTNLRKQGIKSEMIHGKLTQSRRLRVIDTFNKGKVEFLVASSVAARGLHIDDVSHVFNYDLSRDPQEYIHRIGRTARAGESGKAITLLGPKDHGIFAEILHKYKVNVKELPNEEFVKLKFEFGRSNDRSGSGGGFNHRRNSRSPGWKGNGGRSNGFRSRDNSRESSGGFRSNSRSGGNSFRSRDNSRSGDNSSGFRSDSRPNSRSGSYGFRGRNNSGSSGNKFRNKRN